MPYGSSPSGHQPSITPDGSSGRPTSAAVWRAPKLSERVTLSGTVTIGVRMIQRKGSHHLVSHERRPLGARPRVAVHVQRLMPATTATSTATATRGPTTEALAMTATAIEAPAAATPSTTARPQPKPPLARSLDSLFI